MPSLNIAGKTVQVGIEMALLNIAGQTGAER